MVYLLANIVKTPHRLPLFRCCFLFRVPGIRAWSGVSRMSKNRHQIEVNDHCSDVHKLFSVIWNDGKKHYVQKNVKISNNQIIFNADFARSSYPLQRHLLKPVIGTVDTSRHLAHIYKYHHKCQYRCFLITCPARRVTVLAMIMLKGRHTNLKNH